MFTIVAGARPNFIKVAPIVKEIQSRNLPYKFIHTGQHYDYEMSRVFLSLPGLPEPDYDLEVGSGSHAYQTGSAMIKLEEAFRELMPDIVIVVGDVNSTLAGALAATKLGIRVAHIEAGLRSFDRSMPEEINRILTDAISDNLFTTCQDAGDNLKREGIPLEKIFFEGNVMIDSLIAALPLAKESKVLEQYDLTKNEYIYITLHRPSNVDKPDSLSAILSSLEGINRMGIPMVFPMHPRTRNNLESCGLLRRAGDIEMLRTTMPLGYLDAIALTSNAKAVLTDSGGVQEETTYLGVPCLTLRPNTERPITITEGTNILLDQGPKMIVGEVSKILSGCIKKGGKPRLWDGKAAKRVVDVLAA